KYVIKPPVAQPYTPPSHAICTSIAYDIQRNCIIFFKDSWRVTGVGIMRDGEVYATLNDNNVPNIPHCSASGDIGQDNYHSTVTDKYANKSWVMKPSPKSTPKSTPHWHHRLILDNVGQKLETFQCSRDMCVSYAIYFCLTADRPFLAHYKAYWTSNILHHNISPNNILWMNCPMFDSGLLIDWDLCKKVDPKNPASAGAHQNTHMKLQGTWQFMVADLIKNPTISQTFTHDIESTFLVTLWMAVLHL
ncbi:hypothetical protein EI94DRAFT_1539802, partial [Lactarius quietus]